MDKLCVMGLPLTTLIGAYDWEQSTPQTLYCDLVFSTDAIKIAKSDQLKEAIDYAAMAASIEQFVKDHHFQLIETLAEKLASHILAHFSTDWVQLTLHKPSALKQANDVMISIERRR